MTGYPLAKLMRLGLPGSVPPIVLMLAVSPLTESRIGDRDWGDNVCIKHNDQRFLAWPLELPQLALESKLSANGN